MIVGDEYYFDVEGVLEVLPETSNEGISVVTAGRLTKAIPLDPAVEERMAAGLGGGLHHGYALVVSGRPVVDREQVLKTPALRKRAYHVQMQVRKPLVW